METTETTTQRAHVLRTHEDGAIDQLTTERARSLASGQTEVGRTNDVVVYTDGTPQGDTTAQAVLQTAEADFQATQAWFGGITLPAGQEGDDQTTPRTATPVHVLIDPQAGGAYHFGCDATDLYLEPSPDQASGLFVAELVEVFEAAINNGWDCGHTNGEGLSRVLAGERNANLTSLFVQTEQSWWADGRQDFVNDNSNDDTNQDANGCATLFLYYLHSQLGYDWTRIVTTGGSSLGQTYQQLTNQDPTAGFAAFVSLLSSLDSGGTLNVPASGNPFPLTGAAGQPASPAQPGSEQPVPVPAGGSMSDGSMAAAAADGLLVAEEIDVVPLEVTDAAGEPVEAYAVVETVAVAPVSIVADDGAPSADDSAGPQTPSDSAPAPSATPAAPEPVATPEPVASSPASPVADQGGLAAAALQRTAPIIPRGLDAPATAGQGGGAPPALIVALVVLVILVALAALFFTGVL